MIAPKCFQSAGTIAGRSDKYEINRINLLKEKQIELIEEFRRVREKQKKTPVYGSIIKEYEDYYDNERNQKQQQLIALNTIIKHMDDVAAGEYEDLGRRKFDQREILKKINKLEQDISKLKQDIGELKQDIREL